MTHKHHKIPKHMGGTDDPSNLIEVSVEEHAELHLALYLEYGLIGDWIAYHTLSGQIGHDEARRQAASYYMRNRVVSEETKQKISESKKGYGCFTGKKHTKKSKDKMVISARKRSRPIRCIDTGVVYKSKWEASEDLGIPAKQIAKAADPKETRNKTAKGLRFEIIQLHPKVGPSSP